MSALTGDKFCAGSLAGRHVRIEYRTRTDDEGSCIDVYAVHVGDWRIPAHHFAPEDMHDWTREAEAVEMATAGDEEPRHVAYVGGVACRADEQGLPWRKAA